MLSLLPLSALSRMPGGAAVTFKSPTQVYKALGSLGYVFLPADGERRHRDTLTHGGRSVVAGVIEASGLEGQGDKAVPVGLELSIELEFPQEVAREKAPLSPTRAHPPRGFGFSPHLGRTVDAACQIDFEKGITLGRLRRELDAFWRATDDYARAHGGRFAAAKGRDWSRERFDDALELTAPDPVSLERVTDSWGWDFKGAWGSSGPVVHFPVNVHGTRVMLAQDILAKAPYAPAIALGAWATFSAGTDIDRWVRTEGKRLPWADFSPNVPHTVYVRQSVGLGEGLPLGDLRRRIEGFASNVAALGTRFGAKVD